MAKERRAFEQADERLAALAGTKTAWYNCMRSGAPDRGKEAFARYVETHAEYEARLAELRATQ